MAGIDYNADIIQVVAAFLFPITALFLARPNETWVIWAYSVVVLLVIAAFAAMVAVGPTKYPAWLYTPVTIVAIILNVVAFFAIFLGWFQYSESRPAPARDILSVEFVGPLEANGHPSTFSVKLQVKGGQEALSNRTIWIANTKYQPNDSFDDGAVSFAKRPCLHEQGDVWICNSLHLGEIGEYNIYAMLVNEYGLVGILEGWVLNPESGFFMPPSGVDAIDAYRFRRVN